MALTFDNKVTTGNALTAAAMLVSVLMAYTALRESDVRQLAQIVQIEGRVTAIDVETQRVRPEYEARLRAMESSRVGDAAEITGLRREITELKGDLREVKNDLREVAALLRQANGVKP